MNPREHTVAFEPGGRRTAARPGLTLMDLAARAGAALPAPCGGAGRCGQCRVRVICGACEPTPACRAAFSPAELEQGWRLACQARPAGDLVVEVPPGACRAAPPAAAGPAEDADAPAARRPAVVKRAIRLTAAKPGDARAESDRLRAALEPEPFERFGLRALRALPGLRAARQTGATAVLADGELLDLEPGDTTAACYGVAVDLGTTTLAAELVDLAAMRVIGAASAWNPQAAHGDDVLSRIQFCRGRPAGLAQLQAAVMKALNTLVTGLVRGAGIARERIYAITVAGNTAMQQVACGIDPSALGELPFAPVVAEPLRLKAGALGLRAHPEALVRVFPAIGGFVGGDIVAGLLATRLNAGTATRLFMDIGTNGEMVLAHQGRLTAASVAAGLAFEGARISCGMRAAAGAIAEVALGDDLALRVIGGTRPAGLCGSGLIDTAAELLRAGILDPGGRLLEPREWPDTCGPALRRRAVHPGGQPGWLLADAAHSASGRALVLTQRDLRELQVATAAVRAGIGILLGQRGLSSRDLDDVLIAGAFGTFIRRHQALRIGLLPPVPESRIRFVGNAALLGTRRALLAESDWAQAAALARTVEHVDLSQAPGFQEAFSEAMRFPESGPDAGG